MMYLSDKKTDKPAVKEGWVPLDISSIEIVDKEEFQRIERGKPDFSIFKTMYDDPGISESDLFKLLYEPEKEPESQETSFENAFKPMFEDVKGEAGPEPHALDESELESGADGFKGEVSPAELSLLVEQARKDGFDGGFETGRKDGYDKGFAEGVADGEKEGREKGERQGYEAGFERGENESRTAGDEKARVLISSLETILLKTEGTWEQMVKRYEGKMISLVSRIAEKVVMARVSIDKGVVRESIIHALELLPEPEEIVLNVSEEDYEYIETIKEDFFQSVKSLVSISVVSNPGVTQGGCRIESSTARVETDIESRLQAVFNAVVAEGAR